MSNFSSRREIRRRIARLLAISITAVALAACSSNSDNSNVANSDSGPVDPWPTGSLPATAATTVDESEFLPSSLMREWQIDLDERGLRLEASSAEAAFIEVLRERLSRAGVQDIHFEKAEMLRWTANSWGLSTQAEDGGFKSVPTGSFFPYSGNTSKSGITAELTYLTPEDFQTIVTAPNPTALLLSLAPNFAGKIVLMDFPSVPLTADSYASKAIDVFDPANTANPDDPYVRPNVAAGPFKAVMDGLEQIKVRGVVAIYNRAQSPQLANLRIPNSRHVDGLPGVYVDSNTGRQLQNVADNNGMVKLNVDATVETVETRNLVGTIPGANDELVVLNSHTGGSNGAEGDAANAVIDIAQYLARLPQSALDRSIKIVLSSGYFGNSAGTQGFLRQHRNDGLLDRIVAVLNLGQLGLQRGVFNAQGELAAAGTSEPGSLFIPDNPVLKRLSRQWAQNADISLTYIMPQLKPNGAIWPGVGQSVWGRQGGGIPTINYLTRPVYLQNWGIDTVDFIDFDSLHQQTAAFTQMILDLTREPRSGLPQRNKGPAQPSQPKAGPGGSDYTHADVKVSRGGVGPDAWYVFEPIDPKPASAPLVIMMHGYFVYAGYESLREFIWHTVRKGNIVIYPRWQTATADPCQGPFNIEPCMSSAVNGIQGALAYLNSDPRRVQPDLSRTSYFGFSFGGTITANLTNRWASLGLPEPRVVFLDDPHDGGFAGPGEPALDASLAGLPKTALVQCHSGATGVIAAIPNGSCNAVFPLLTSVPEENKDLVLTYNDPHGIPGLSSSHGVCKSEPDAADAYDYYFCWKVFDALRSCAYDGIDCEYALGDTAEHRFNGIWEDAIPVTPLKIQDSAPIDSSATTTAPSGG